jgi:hypothetical protein
MKTVVCLAARVKIKKGSEMSILDGNARAESSTMKLYRSTVGIPNWDYQDHQCL